MGISGEQAASDGAACCPHFHEAIELIGKRWSGAIVFVLLDRGPLRFSEIASAVPQLSDRLLSQRIKELEQHGLLRRHVGDGRPVRVTYELTAMGRDLAPALVEVRSWGRRWLAAAHGGAREAPSGTEPLPLPGRAHAR